MDLSLNMSRYLSHRLHSLKKYDLLSSLQSSVSNNSKIMVSMSTYPKVMNHVTMQHARSGKRNLIPNSRPVPSSIPQSTSIAYRRINQVKVVPFTGIDSVLDTSPRKSTVSRSDDPRLVVVFVKRMLSCDVGTVFKDDVYDGSVQESVLGTQRGASSGVVLP